LTPPSHFEIGRVLRRSQDIVRSRWLEILALTVLLAWALPQLISLVAESNYREWSHDLTPLGLGAAVWIGKGLTYRFAQGTIMAAALRRRDEPRFSGISRVLRALPVLIPVWLLSDIEIARRLWVSWTASPHEGTPYQKLAGALTVSGVELFLALGTMVAVGVFYPVILDEGRGPFGAMSRAWRLMHGNRWRFVGLLLLYLATVLLIGLPRGLLPIEARADRSVVNFVGWVTGGLSVAVESLWSVVVVASFIELRWVKEGSPQDRTAEAFA
jgi:hypothetical protein